MRKATITIKENNYSTDIKKSDGTILPKGTKFISVDFEGYQEGSGSPCDSEEEAQQVIKKIMLDKEGEYDFKIIDERKNETIEPRYGDERESETIAEPIKQLVICYCPKPEMNGMKCMRCHGTPWRKK